MVFEKSCSPALLVRKIWRCLDVACFFQADSEQTGCEPAAAPRVGVAMDKPKYCEHCGAVIVADSDRPHLEIGPRFRTLEPRWATMEGAAVYSGLSRALLWAASKEGHIRTASVRRGADKKRGRRLVDLRSLDEWIEKYVCG